MGAFRFVNPVRHPGEKETFYEAHNDYVELLYNSGFIGLILFLGAIWRMVKINLVRLNEYRIALLSSFLCIAINAGGLFVWQIAPIIFNTLVIAGLLHKEEDHGV